MGGAPGGAGRWGGGMAARWRQDGGKIAARLHLAVHWRVGQHVRHVRVRAVELDELIVGEILWGIFFWPSEREVNMDHGRWEVGCG